MSCCFQSKPNCSKEVLHRYQFAGVQTKYGQPPRSQCPQEIQTRLHHPFNQMLYVQDKLLSLVKISVTNKNKDITLIGDGVK